MTSFWYFDLSVSCGLSLCSRAEKLETRGARGELLVELLLEVLQALLWELVSCGSGAEKSKTRGTYDKVLVFLLLHALSCGLSLALAVEPERQKRLAAHMTRF